jgi:hypothetical protein
MDNDEPTNNDEADRAGGERESWIAEQARLVLLEDGS